MERFLRTAPLLLVLLLPVACGDDPTDPTGPPVPENAVEYFFSWSMNPRATPLEEGGVFFVEVTGPDLDRSWEYTVPMDSSGGRQVLLLPGGEDRTIAMAVVDAGGDTTHAGSAVRPIMPGRTVWLNLEEVGGHRTVFARFAQAAVRIDGGESGQIPLGSTQRLEGVVYRPDGSVLDADVVWGSSDPDRAYVDDDGVVHAYATGTVTITATFEGVVATRVLEVREESAMVADTIAWALWHWNRGYGEHNGPSFLLSTLAFQHSTWTNCAGGGPQSGLPRPPISNAGDSAHCAELTIAWDASYVAAGAAAWGLQRLAASQEVRTALADQVDRLEAFAHFVLGTALGTVAIMHSHGMIVDETVDLSGQPALPLVPYGEVMAAALAQLDRAEELAGAGTFTIPGPWIGGFDASAAELAGRARSLRARFRAAVARTPSERAAVDWGSVLADLDGAATWELQTEFEATRNWYRDMYLYYERDAYQELTYWVLGMADQSGTYQDWVATPLADKRPEVDGAPFLIITPDQRFAQGGTLEEQAADSESRRPRYGVPPFDVERNFGQPQRGRWRWSYYWTYDVMDNAVATWEEIPQAELDLLRAEALYRLAGNQVTPEAAALVDGYRAAAGLDPSGDGNDDCVPRLPDGTCGDFLEMLKWEKRIETQFRGLHGAPWYFDGRGWGDLYEGTPVHLPIPCSEVQERGLPCSTFGGVGGEAAAERSVYGWSDYE